MVFVFGKIRFIKSDKLFKSFPLFNISNLLIKHRDISFSLINFLKFKKFFFLISPVLVLTKGILALPLK